MRRRNKSYLYIFVPREKQWIRRMTGRKMKRSRRRK